MRNSDTVNLKDLQILEIEQISIHEFHPLPNGAGPPTQVHLLFSIKGMHTELVLRLKSRIALEEICIALQSHADSVWPKD